MAETRPGRIPAWAVHILFAGMLMAIGLSIGMLSWQEAGLQSETLQLELSEVLLQRRPDQEPGPVVVIAHGFAGSRQLMSAYAIALARHGYTVASFDFLGHGGNGRPLTGSLVETSGATLALLEQLQEVVDRVSTLPGADQGVGLLGHSMAGDIIIRHAQENPDVDAVVGISMYASTLTPTDPGNLLMIVGQFEHRLRQEAIAQLPVSPGVSERTYGAFVDGSARRLVVAPAVEHVGVLYSQAAVSEAVAWFDAAWGRDAGPPLAPARGPWILLLLTGLVVSARGLAARLPVLSPVRLGAALSRKQFLWVAVPPVLLVPLMLWPLPTSVLPVLVADYLGFHFAAYGLVTAGLLGLVSPRRRGEAIATGYRVPVSRLLLPIGWVLLYGLGAFVLAIDQWLTAFLLIPERWTLFWALLPGLAIYSLADAWITDGAGSHWQRAWATRSLFLVSLGFAVALDFEALFFLIIILPIIVLYSLVYGLMSGWVTRRTGHPAVAAVGNAVVFAWALAATFPLVAA